MNFSEYTVSVTTEPSYYGSNCTQSDADRIAGSLTSLIEGQFPGVNVVRSEGKTTGPDSGTVDDINDWISNNWTAAL